MGALKHMAVWQQVRHPRTALLLTTLAFCLVRARDQPSVSVAFGSTHASIVPADLLLLLLAVVGVLGLRRVGVGPGARVAIGAAVSFCLLVVGTGAANGAEALVSGTKLVELAALGVGGIVLIRTTAAFEAIVDLLLAFTVAADVVAVVHFATQGGRQASFLGEHDFAALATLPLLYGLTRVAYGTYGARTMLAVVAGAAGCTLGAALASLLGLYLGAAALILVAAPARALTWRRLVVIAASVAIVTAGTLVIRAGDLGFLQSWFGQPASRPGQYAASWSQRLIYAYIGGKVFVAHPLIGTGWYGELPPRAFVAYLPTARARFADQPAAYFPPADRPFIPQQAWDQILYELGVAGAALMLVLLASLTRAASHAARRLRGVYSAVPAAWLAATIGALAGEGFFGGTPLAASFWLVAGIVLALSRPLTDTC